VLSFPIGTRPTLTVTFRNLDGELEDPSAITFRLKPPQGDIVVNLIDAATNVSVGVWEWQLPDPLDAPGTWWLSASATGGMQTADEICFQVPKSKFPVLT
jgi:hypothetical protein